VAAKLYDGVSASLIVLVLRVKTANQKVRNFDDEVH